MHEDLDSREIIVHGQPLTDPDDIGQLRHLSSGEVPIVVPRELLVDFGPKEVTRVPRIIDLDAFGRLFENFEHTAWRLETRRRYTSDEATDTYQQFLRGESPTWDMTTSWSTTIREKTASGATVARVRIIDSPPTAGQRYLLAHAEKNAALGEEVRNLWRADAQRLRLPEADFWLFDSRLVGRLNFDAEDNLVDVELITEPVEVNLYAQARDAAWHYATAYTEFAAQLATND